MFRKFLFPTGTVGILKGIKKAGKHISALSGNTFAKGDLFEELVVKLLPEQQFSIIHATTRRNDLSGRRIESAKDPDLHIRHRKSNHKFWVECKYRGDLYEDKVNWCRQYQLDRYRAFQEERRPEKLYIVIGFGGMVTRPESLYCVPLDDMKYPDLYLTTLQPYWHPRNRPFDYSCGRLR